MWRVFGLLKWLREPLCEHEVRGPTMSPLWRQPPRPGWLVWLSVRSSEDTRASLSRSDPLKL